MASYDSDRLDGRIDRLESVRVSLSGNTAGVSTVLGTALVLQGGANVTLSGTGSTVVVSGGAGGGGTGGVYAVSNTFGTSSGTYSVGTLSIAGVGIVSVAASNSGWRISASQSAQTVGMYAASNTTQSTSGTADARSLTFAGAGIASVGVTGGSVLVSVPAGGGAGDGVNALVVNGGASTASTTLTLSNSNNVSFGLAGGVITATATVSQTNQTGNVYAASNTFGTSSGTYDARTLSIRASGGIYVAASNSGWQLWAADSLSLFLRTNTTVSSSGNWPIGFANVIGAGNVSVGFSTANSGLVISGTQTVQPAVGSLNGSSGTLTVVAGNLMSVSNNASTISVINVLSSSNAAAAVGSVSSAGLLSSRFALADHVHPGVGGFGASNTGNTAGNTGTSYGTWLIAGTNNVTVSESTGGLGIHTLWLSAAAGGAGGSQSIGMSTQTAGGGTGGTTGYASGSAVLYHFVPGSNITMSQSVNGASGTLSVYGPSPGAGSAINRSFLEVMEGERFTTACNLTGLSFSKRPIIVPFYMPGASLGLNTVRFFMSRVAGTSLNCTMGVAFYSANNSTSLTRFASTTHAYSLTTSSLFSGLRRYDFTGLGASSLTEGRWFIALYMSGSNDSTAVANLAPFGGDVNPVGGIVHPGTNSTAATASGSRLAPFWGVYSNTTAGFPNGIGLSEIQGGNSAQAVDIYAAIIEGTV